MATFSSGPLAAKWHREAENAARFVRQNLHNTHRGAMWWTEMLVVLFGNDGYEQTDWVKREVAILRQQLQSLGIAELAFSLSDDGNSWQILIRSLDGQASAWNSVKRNCLLH